MKLPWINHGLRKNIEKNKTSREAMAAYPERSLRGGDSLAGLEPLLPKVPASPVIGNDDEQITMKLPCKS